MSPSTRHVLSPVHQLVFLLLFTACTEAAYTDIYKHEAGKCITQGACGSGLPCAHINTIEPIVPDAEHVELLKSACPMYAEKSVCCDKDQLKDFAGTLITVKSIIGGCEACIWDFQVIECGFFCDSDQSTFLQITKTQPDETDDQKTAAVGVRYFISEGVAKRSFDTCKNVHDSIMGGIGIVYVCGSADCDQETFYTKLGDNKLSPLKIEFIIGDTSTVSYVKPLTDKEIYDCKDTVNGKECPCHDCEEIICPIVMEKKTTTYWHYTLPIGLGLCLIWILVVAVLTFRHKSITPTNEIEIKPVPAGLDNKAVELNSPIAVHESATNVYANNTAVPANGDCSDTVTLPQGVRPPELPLSPTLSQASTVSPLPNSPTDETKHVSSNTFATSIGSKLRALSHSFIFNKYHDHDTRRTKRTGIVTDLEREQSLHELEETEVANHTGVNGVKLEEAHALLNGNGYEYEVKSLIKKHEPAYECWIRLGPRLGETWANLVYDYWYIVLLICVVLAALCSGGWYNFRITTDPIELWTSENSISRQQKYEYDDTFGTTYRTCQLVVKEKAPTTFGVDNTFVSGVFNPDVMKEVYDMMQAIQSLKVGDVTYSDLCYKPLGEFNTVTPAEDCATLSVFQWLGNDRSLLDKPAEYIKKIALCAEANVLPECLSAFRGPSDTNVVLGGYDASTSKYLDSTTLMVTFALDGSPAKLDNILLWETAMKDYLLKEIAERKDIKIAFSTDRALEDEIDRASHADIFTIVLSYILMFVYVGLTLGEIECSVTGCLLNSKALLGVGGVVIVLVSVISALGVTSYAGLPTTLIVIEVIPFLILAVGVDNVYIMVQGIQRVINERIEREEPINSASVKGIVSAMMRDVFPAMILSSLCQIVAFALGSLSFMPSVQNFAYNATIALLMNFILQTTIFLILIRADLKRQLSGRLDVVCCVKTKLEKPDRGPTRWFIEEYWSKYLLINKWVPAIVLIFFGCFTVANVMLIPDLGLGLEPTMALPGDSYLLDYYHTAYNDYRIGPSMSFVFKSTDGSELDIYDEKVYGELISNDNSLLKTIRKYGASPDFQYVSGKGSSFMEEFSENWLDLEPCCWNKESVFCPSIKDRTGCSECPQTDMTTDTKYKYLQWFISDIPRTDGTGCSKGGAVSYSNSAKFSSTKRSVIAGRFTASHGVLSSSPDFRRARQQAILIADEVNENNDLIEVYAYSSFYPFYEQYDTIVRECSVNLAVTIVATFIVALVLLGFQVHAALCVMLSVTMCAVDMLGSMVYLDIPLNAISLVNLLLSVGIAVEFSANIVQAYTVSKATSRVNKARDALRKTGPAIVSGIAMTNFVGVIVLAAAKSQLFVIFYFRMFFTINCLCVAHTILFLPAFLGFIGD